MIDKFIAKRVEELRIDDVLIKPKPWDDGFTPKALSVTVGGRIVGGAGFKHRPWDAEGHADSRDDSLLKLGQHEVFDRRRNNRCLDFG